MENSTSKIHIGDIVMYRGCPPASFVTTVTSKYFILNYNDETPVYFEFEYLWEVFATPGNWFVCKKSIGDIEEGTIVRLEERIGMITDQDGNSYYVTAEELCSEHFQKWDVLLAKRGDILYCPKGVGCELIFLAGGFEIVERHNSLCSPAAYRVAEDDMVYGGLGLVWSEGCLVKVYPATRKQKELFFEKLQETGGVYKRSTGEFIPPLKEQFTKFEKEFIKIGKKFAEIYESWGEDIDDEIDSIRPLAEKMLKAAKTEIRRRSKKNR